jgi:hypothetical protein
MNKYHRLAILLQKYASWKNVTGSFLKKHKQCRVKEKMKGLVVDK